VHARRIRPDTGALDRRRLAAAFLSAVLPGLGQLANGRRRLAAVFLVPSLILLAIGLLAWMTQTPARLAAMVAAPTVLNTLLTLSLLLLALRLVSVVQAFLDTRWHGPTGRVGIIGLLLLIVAVIVPHVIVHRYGTAFGETFARVFQAGSVAGEVGSPDRDQPALDERVNVLLLGIDALPWRPATLTDTMIVVSLDPVGKTISMASVPRDLINVPLGNGDVFGPKLNSLMSYADRHPDEFPDGGIPTLQDAVGALLGIDIHYYARMDFYGFVDMVQAVGGVDVTVAEGFDDPTYDGFGFQGKGYKIKAGTHHLNGYEALAYARARKAAGESDFTRAGRQQQILVALRDAVTGSGGGLLFQIPDLLDAVGDTVVTDVPVERLPELAAVVDEIDDDALTRVVIRHPLLKSRTTRYGSSLVPDVEAIQAVAAKLFPEPGEAPTPWPTPKPTKTPEPSTTPEP
jgi:LCP family protein required for cell wall assembly